MYCFSEHKNNYIDSLHWIPELTALETRRARAAIWRVTMSYTIINIFLNCSLSTVLTATDQKLQKSSKVILPTVTSLECQCDAEEYHLFVIFAAIILDIGNVSI